MPDEVLERPRTKRCSKAVQYFSRYLLQPRARYLRGKMQNERRAIVDKSSAYLRAVHDHVGTPEVVVGAVVHGVVLRCLVPEGVQVKLPWRKKKHRRRRSASTLCPPGKDKPKHPYPHTNQVTTSSISSRSEVVSQCGTISARFFPLYKCYLSAIIGPLRNQPLSPQRRNQAAGNTVP